MNNETFDICPDCDEEMEVYVETCELVCPSCGRGESLFSIVFHEAQFYNQESQTGQPLPAAISDTYLRKILEKYKIFQAVNTVISDGREVFDPERYHFLANVIFQFRSGDKSTNYICFLHDYFQAVSSEVWPRKNEILKLLSPHLPKISKPAVTRKKGLISGGG